MNNEIVEGYSPSQLRDIVEKAGRQKYLVEGFLPLKSIGFLIGGSGLGKSALAYQLAVAVAGGVPFLDLPTVQARVLYMDFENGPEQSLAMVDAIAAYLQVPRETLDKQLVLWNVNASEKWGEQGCRLSDHIQKHRPGLTIIDSFGSYQPDAEEKNARTNQELQFLRKLFANHGTGFFVLHHIKKDSDKVEFGPVPLEKESRIQKWFQRARGASAVINGSDVRLGVESSSEHSQAAFVLRGFARVRGELSRIYVQRLFDEDGQEIAYKRMLGTEFLKDIELDAFERLPEKFRFKEARIPWEAALGAENQRRRAGKKPEKGLRDEDITDFLNAACAAGLLRKISRRDGYEKVIV